MSKINLSNYTSPLSLRNKLLRLIWKISWNIFIRLLPRGIGRKWVRLILLLFGAKIHKTANIYSSARIYMPWNLEMHEYSCLGPEVDCYNVSKIVIGSHSVISQKTYLCAASHDVYDISYQLIHKPIYIEDQVWIGADAFISMGVRIKQGAVVGARASVFKDVEPWTIVGGNPAKVIKKRIIHNA